MHYEWMLVEIVVFERGWVTLSANFKEEGGLCICICLSTHCFDSVKKLQDQDRDLWAQVSRPRRLVLGLETKTETWEK